ncbi:prostaglandin E2 receptor EP3 subtype [Hippoglossus hippoglossus]|uniref:prostaglandin E2 receptor EP3 subtype n=1 Tax=Hippoglossus hippoglossus TaxID=8267 RepID=UPI00148CD818|nr:prostaglandin E2 receptor EP3 subtype [Hippoglossus hippoglossus]
MLTAMCRFILPQRMTADSCDSVEGSQTSAAEMLSANISKTLGEDNVTKNSSCGSVSVGFPITMMITGMVGNSLALILVYVSYIKKENKRKRSFLLCIGSLALTDLFGQLLTSPIVISVYRADLSWERIDSSGTLCAFFGVCMTTFGLCALFLASAMAIERAMAITNPHWYSSHMRTSVTKQTLAAIWLLVLLFALLPIAGVGKYTRQWPGTWCFISIGDREVPGNMFFAITFAVLGIFSLLVTLSCNVVTIRGLIVRCKTKSGTSQSSKQWERLTTETVIQLLGIMCVLLVCWSPLLVLMLRMISTQASSHHCNSKVGISTNSSSRDVSLDCNFFLTAIRLASLNQILDPWVYLLLREILLRKFCIVANAMSNCSLEGRKENQNALDALNKQSPDSSNLHKAQSG